MLTALAIAKAVFLGTSRGGILTMLLAAARPTAIAGCVLNDIGPVIDPKGLMRIKSYVGRMPRPASFHEGADILRRLFGSQFPKWTDDAWVAFARRTFKEAGDADRSRLRSRGSRPFSVTSTSTVRCRRCGRSSMRSPASR